MKELLISDLINTYVLTRVKSEVLINSIALNNLFFLHCSINEFNKTLLDITGEGYEGKRYPFIWINNGGGNVVSEIYVDHQYIKIGQILIGTLSKNSYLSDERTAQVFKPILIPLKDAFMKVLDGNNTRAIQLLGDSYECENHYFYGKDKDSNPFNDFIDVIEIKDITLRINKDCET